MKFVTKHTCPFCKISETPSTLYDHFLTYTQSSSNINLRLYHIKKCLTLLETSKQLTAMIIRGLQYIYYSSILQPFNQDSKEIIHIYEHQSAISWNNFIRGRISKRLKVFM